MKIGMQPENFFERIAVWFNLAPAPLVDTQIAFNAARAIMAGNALGLFDAVRERPLEVSEIAARCATDPRATRALANCLVGLGYLEHSAGRYSNSAIASKWLVKDSPHSVRDKLLFQEIEWEWMGRLEEFVRTGRTLDIHSTMTPAQWASYQDAMRALSATIAPLVAEKIPMPASATRMLDIGGSHGLYSAALCRKHPQLNSTILELPDAIERAAAIVEREGLGARVQHKAGDALRDDLGEAIYDLVLISNVVHHFTHEQCVGLAKRVARSLKPGGHYVIGEFDRNDEPGRGGAIGATSDLYFAFTSTSGTWSAREIAAWQKEAGFVALRAIRYTQFPGYLSQVGRKP